MRFKIKKLTENEKIKWKDKLFLNEWMFLHEDTYRNREIILVLEHEKVAGFVSYVEQSFIYPELIGIAAVEIADQYKGNGLASMLLHQLFIHAQNVGKGIRTGHFTEEGEKRLMSIFKRNQVEYDVDVMYC